MSGWAYESKKFMLYSPYFFLRSAKLHYADLRNKKNQRKKKRNGFSLETLPLGLPDQRHPVDSSVLHPTPGLHRGQKYESLDRFRLFRQSDLGSHCQERFTSGADHVEPTSEVDGVPVPLKHCKFALFFLLQQNFYLAYFTKH